MAEAMLLGEDTSQAAKAQELLERALQIDPHSPKALFYSAVAAFAMDGWTWRASAFS